MSKGFIVVTRFNGEKLGINIDTILDVEYVIHDPDFPTAKARITTTGE